MKRPSIDEIREELARRRAVEAEETRRVQAIEDARIAEATERFLESTYLSLDDLEAAHRGSERRRRIPSQ